MTFLGCIPFGTAEGIGRPRQRTNADGEGLEQHRSAQWDLETGEQFQ